MCFLRAKPIGLMPMLDQGEQDDKIIAVHADDPEFSGFNDISEIPRHRLAEIKRLCAQPFIDSYQGGRSRLLLHTGDRTCGSVEAPD